MQPWTASFIAALGLVIMGLTAHAFVLHRRCGRLAAELRRQVCYGLDMPNFTRLLQQITDADWQQYPAVLVRAIVAQGYATHAALLAVNEKGELELLTSTSAYGPDWNPRADPAIQAALGRKERLYLSEGQRICLPIPAAAEPTAFLVAAGVRANPARSTPAPFLEASAALTHMTLINQRAMMRQLSLSTMDGLTGLFNHRHLQQVLSVILGQSYLEHTFPAFIILDIDHFKLVNDTYGHLYGDTVLREVANVLRRAVSPDAVVARYGGEEFAVVLQDCSVAEAAQVAERLRAAVETHPFPGPVSGTPVRVTVSLGVSVYVLGMGKSKLIARADEALYLSKQNGRNRVTVLPPESADDARPAPVLRR